MLHEQQGYVMLHANAPCLNVQLANRWGTAIRNLLTISHTRDGMNPAKKEGQYPGRVRKICTVRDCSTLSTDAYKGESIDRKCLEMHVL